MKFVIETDINKFSKAKTANFLKNSITGNIFNSLDMFNFYQNTNKWDPLFLGVKDSDNELQGVLLCVLQKEKSGFIGYFTSRAIVFSGPVIVDNLSEKERKEIIELLLKELVNKAGGKSIYFQFRNLFQLQEYKTVFEKFGFKYLKHLNFRVDTRDPDITWSHISKSKKRQIKQSLKNGAKILEPDNIQPVKDFYTLLKSLYKKKVKKPLPDWIFFKYFFEESRSGKLGKYFLIELNNKIIGGIMCPITPGKVIYEWYICGMDGVFKGIYPSVLSTWAAIDYACKNKFECFDFMGAGKPDEGYGVREFKSKFGGELVEFGRFERINNKFLYALGKLGIKILGILR